MIISDQQKKVFCHIPKNGGSSLRRYFQDQWSDAREYQGRKPVDCLGGEVRDLTHLTISESEEYFGEQLIAGGYQVTAIIRRPEDRIKSSILQYVRSFGPGGRSFIDSAGVKSTFRDEPIEALCARAEHDHRCIYFRRQTDFLNGLDFGAHDLVLMGNLSTRFPKLQHENRGGAISSSLARFDVPLIRRVAQALGPAAKARLKSLLVRPQPDLSSAIEDIVSANKNFLKEFYKSDQALYDQVALCETAQ